MYIKPMKAPFQRIHSGLTQTKPGTAKPFLGGAKCTCQDKISPTNIWSPEPLLAAKTRLPKLFVKMFPQMQEVIPAEQN